MGRKKKRIRPVIFCYYCDRLFENEGVLIQHQRAKHFKCPRCHKKVSTAHGMKVHVFQVHATAIESVPAAKEGRDSFDIAIIGMDGVPPDIIEKRRIKIYGQSAQKRQKLGQHMMPANINGIQIPGSRQIFNHYGQMISRQGVMPMGQVVGMPMYSGYPPPVLPQAIPLPLTAAVPTPYAPLQGGRPPRIISGGRQTLVKQELSLQKTSQQITTPPRKLVPQTSPTLNHSSTAPKTLPPSITPQVRVKKEEVKNNAITLDGTPQPQINSPSAPKIPPVRPGSSPSVPIPISRQGKSPIIPFVEDTEPIVSYPPPPLMPTITPQGPPPMRPPPKLSSLPTLPLRLSPPPTPTRTEPLGSPKRKKNTIRIYCDESMSQEEKRAMHPKYNAHLNKRITFLSQSIEERLKSLQ